MKEALSPSERGGSAVDLSKPPTIAGFSPNTQNFSSHRHRSTILVHQKSPLLLATPPQVTRALAYSHPFIVPLNKLVGLLSWTTEDPWESFLVVAAFWFTTLYGSHIIRYAGPVLLVTFLIVGMYLRRYSPLSSTEWTGQKQKSHRRDPSDVGAARAHKSLDEIIATLQTFTTRCNILLDPFLRLTDFLSTQQTATTATTQPALTTLFIRIMIASPLWWALALPPSPFRILTTRRITLVFGTIILSWHSRPARISRTILWRSRTVRRACSVITGLEFGTPSSLPPPLPPRLTPSQSAIALANKRNGDEGIRFTFTLFENQRRWLGIGWTTSMLAYERATWTDEHLNECPSPQRFELPDVEGGMAKWRWVKDSRWHVETGTKIKESGTNTKTKALEKEAESDEDAWVYYDNKWRDGRRGQDGWGRYTRRRKWVRDAELVDVDPAEAAREREAAEHLEMKRVGRMFESTSELGTDSDTIMAASDAGASTRSSAPSSSYSATGSDSGTSPPGSYKGRSWLARGPAHTRSRPTSSTSMSGDGDSVSSSLLSRAAFSGEPDMLTPTAILKEREAEWGLGDDVNMVLG